MTKKFNLPIFPKVLTDKVEFALYCIKDVTHEDVVGLLDAYRRNLIKSTVAKGVSGKHIPRTSANAEELESENLEPFPVGQWESFRRLDDAFKALYAYLDGGAIDYIASDVDIAICSLKGKAPKKAAEGKSINKRNKEICKYMEKHSYTTSSDKADLVERAHNHFDVSVRTIRTAISLGGMTNKKK